MEVVMRRTVLILMALLFIALTSVVASAQSSQDVHHLLKRLEKNTDRFANSLDHALDHSSLNGSRTEDEINAYVHDFEEATDRLKSHYDHHGSDPENTREVLLRARTIECIMHRYDF